MRVLPLLIFLLISLPSFGQSDTSRLARFTSYQQTLLRFRVLVKSTTDLGIDIFQPDYAQPGGGTPFKTATLLQSRLRQQANELGLKSLDDGWYAAMVSYDNSNTLTLSTYTLDTKVQQNRVVVISFPNGGSVHSGPNNSGYIYSGGDLELDHVISGDIVRAFTIVYIQNRSSQITYTVTIVPK
jgi:hypothetical protein